MNYWNNDLYFIIPKIKHETQTGDIILKKNVSYIYPYPIDSFEIKGDSSFRYLIIKKRHIERKQRELESRAPKKSDKGLEDQASLYKERANELGKSLLDNINCFVFAPHPNTLWFNIKTKTSERNALTARDFPFTTSEQSGTNHAVSSDWPDTKTGPHSV